MNPVQKNKKMTKNKKSLNTVVIILILILLVLSAVAIVWSSIGELLNNDNKIKIGEIRTTTNYDGQYIDLEELPCIKGTNTSPLNLEPIILSYKSCVVRIGNTFFILYEENKSFIKKEFDISNDTLTFNLSSFGENKK